jgi:hypothetical protein
MAIFLITSTREDQRRADGRQSFLANAADETAARELAGVPASWSVHQIAPAGTLPLDPATETPVDLLAIEGRALLPGGLTRGGSPVKAIHAA